GRIPAALRTSGVPASARGTAIEPRGSGGATRHAATRRAECFADAERPPIFFERLPPHMSLQDRRDVRVDRAAVRRLHLELLKRLGGTVEHQPAAGGKSAEEQRHERDVVCPAGAEGERYAPRGR